MAPTPNPAMFKFGPYQLDLRAGELLRNGYKVRLQEKPMLLLAALAEQQGQVVTREELKGRLWPGDTFVDFETGLNTAVSKLRDVLSDDAEKPRYIETIPRRGYRFVFPVEVIPSSGSTTPPPPVSLPVVDDSSALAAHAQTVESGKWRRAPVWIISLLGALALGGLAVWFFEGRASLSFDSRDSVLVADFENQTGDPRFDNALGTAFVVSVEQSRYANVFPRTRLDSVLTRMEKPLSGRITPALGREICQRENIRGLIATGITRTGQEYALTAQLVDPQSGETVRSFTERSYGEDHILEALDVLAKEIREALGESLYQIHEASKPLPQVTTQSLSALQQYAEGTALWHQGRYEDADTLFKAAVAGDSGFAMAHAALGRACYSYIFNVPEEGQKEYEKALSLISRTTDRERMIIETDYALDRNHLDEAQQLFGVYLNRYPDDVAMRFDYANLLRRNDRRQDAIVQYNEVLRAAPDFAQAFVGIATTSNILGNLPAALQAYSKAFEIEPQLLTAGNMNREYGFTLVANGENQKAAEVFSALLAKPETRENGLRSLAFLDLYRGRYASAQDRLQQSLEILRREGPRPLSVARVYLLLSIVAEGKGDTKEVLQNLDAASSNLKDLQSKVVFGALCGDAYARAGFADQAEKIAAMITPIADQNNPEQMGYLHLLEGDIALSAGQRDKAIELLEQSDKEDSTGLSSEALAHGYQKSGDIDKAISSYEKMLSSTDHSLGWEPQQRWLEARYTLALDYSSRGDKQKAREMLATLLNLWKDADANLPLLKQAKAEYAKLQ